ncbi:hypothetical protein CEUSTIGMA_g5003.t1 [Chlamydomonas eustigma]|uniref:Uncharacterized protein n=1 Tax=Chlamydomonas eustigma TaxID=1157962 RepID=A0A250X3R2_9CHLO|nr:hypothetical protein CEUSTIGMA_g5003.t1 [Chlamydomonas eustigma]|eukprot:GAX77559.1 hypothetical protein CEUSTIGMA_g5003.t1 [Chlamydomonas eustigma]
MLIIITVILSVFAVSIAAQSISVPATPVAALSVFPYCACSSYLCSVGPYKLVYYNTTQNATEVDLQFQIVKEFCPPAEACCSALTNSLEKIEFEVVMNCLPNFLGVTVNGVKKTATFDTSFATAKIVITALGLNITTANMAIVSIRMKPSGCDSLQTLCLLGGGTCTYTTFESSLHKCCPICETTFFSPPLPPSPTHPTSISIASTSSLPTSSTTTTFSRPTSKSTTTTSTTTTTAATTSTTATS